MSQKHQRKKEKNHNRQVKSASYNKAEYWPWFVLTIIILFTAAIRIRLLQIPLERDEGEFAYMGQLMLQGIPPYLMAYVQKLPGIYAIYALMMAIFGQTISGIHLGLLIANCIGIIVLFLLTRRLFDNIAAIIAALCYALLSVSPSVLGTSAHATQFIVPFALGGTILLLKAMDSKKYLMLLMSGLLYGFAFTVKQHAIFFIAFALIYFTVQIIFLRPIDGKRLVVGNSLLAIGSALPFLLICAVLYYAGVFPNFWFWTFKYAGQYVSIVTVSAALENFMTNIIHIIDFWILLWIVAGIGITTIFWNDKSRRNGYFLLCFFFFSFLTICPGFYFRDHYFITLLPAVAMLAGVAATASIQWLHEKKIAPIIRIIPVFVIATAIIYPVVKLGDFFFKATPVEACRLMYGLNPFPESIEIGEYIKNHSTQDDRIVIIGSEPQIYFYADRKAATGYIYTYRLMRAHKYASKMQLDMIKEIEASRPQYAVLVTVPASWVRKPESDTTIIKWSETYFNQNYTTVGLIDAVSENAYKVYWDEEAGRNKPLSTYSVFVMKRTVR
jgi:hypothetical protein